jgi:uncharacterized membrane protein YfcA
MDTTMLMTGLCGVLVGIGASFSGLGGGFIMVPLLLFMGDSAQKAVGTSFLAILVISASAVLAPNKLANVDYRAGILLGLGGIVGAQIRCPASGAGLYRQFQEDLCRYSPGAGGLRFLQKMRQPAPP